MPSRSLAGNLGQMPPLQTDCMIIVQRTPYLQLLPFGIPLRPRFER
jgi:hypothetical protein